MDKRGSISISSLPKPRPADAGAGYWGVKTVAAILDRTELSVQRWWRIWDIPFFHQGGKLLVDPADFDQWIEKLKAKEAVAKRTDAEAEDPKVAERLVTK